MSSEFYAEPDPSKELCTEVAAFAPTNPFYTAPYMEARRAMGSQPWILALRQKGKLISACTAFMKSGYLNRSLEIPSLPVLSESEVFWKELLRFCRNARVSHLVVNSLASTSAVIPTLPGEAERRARCEYVIELQDDLWKQTRQSHRWRINRGRKAGLKLICSATPQAYQEHASVVSTSMARRKHRGEAVSTDIQVGSFKAFIEKGAGELFQVVLDQKVLSSAVVLMAERGAYYQSSGTSPEGMRCGASHLLIHEISKTLQDRGMELFNLGGTDELHPGLEEFKSGFGAKGVKLESAKFFLGGALKKKLVTAARLLRDAVRSEGLGGGR